MDPKSHTNGIGNIVTNLQALETVLRGFLVERFGQCAAFPKMGDETACRNYLTAYASLGDLIDDYHRDLSEPEKKFSIDPTVVVVRDALAHGRLIVRGSDPAPPFELWKFGKVRDGKVQVEFSETLTEDWLKSKWLLIDAERQKVFECGKARGYKRLS
jgi:hypothetical protein